jgi:hypothetical protein
MKARNIISWLTQDEASPKHVKDWKHPMTACLIHYFISSFVILKFHDRFLLRIWNTFAKEPEEIPDAPSLSLCSSSTNIKGKFTAGICLIYAIILLIVRLAYNTPGTQKKSVLYEFTWLCNAALLVGGGFGLATCRSRVATGFAVAVSVDQTLWYVDALGYTYNSLLSRNNDKMFPIGVCQYLIWPQTQWSSKITCTHHFWTIPLLLYGAGGFDWGSYIMSLVIVFVFVVLSRWLTPFGLHAKNDTATKGFEKYLNVNLSHELWQDIKIRILRRHGDNQSTGVYILRLNLWWSFFNLLCFLLLKMIERILLWNYIS